MDRKYWNEKIYHLLKFNEDVNNLLIKYDKMGYFFNRLWEMIQQYPDWRFGQIFYNKFAPLYEQDLEGEFEVDMMNLLFGTCHIDAFYEESINTYKRLDS